MVEGQKKQVPVVLLESLCKTEVLSVTLGFLSRVLSECHKHRTPAACFSHGLLKPVANGLTAALAPSLMNEFHWASLVSSVACSVLSRCC